MNINTNYNYPNHNHTNFKAIQVKLNKQSPTIQKYLSTTNNTPEQIITAQKELERLVECVRHDINRHTIRSIIQKRHPEVAGKYVSDYNYKWDFFTNNPELTLNLVHDENVVGLSNKLNIYLTNDEEQVLIAEGTVPIYDSPAKQLAHNLRYYINPKFSIFGDNEDYIKFFSKMLDKSPEYTAFAEKINNEIAEKKSEVSKNISDWFNQ